MTPTRDPETAAPAADRLARRFVCRVSGAPTGGVDGMRAERAMERLQALLDAEARLEEGREDVSALLFAAVGAAADRPARNKILRAKRDLYNLRGLPADALEGALQQLDASSAERVRAFAAELEERDAVRAQVEEALAEETPPLRARFRELLRDAEFRKGLMVSSRSLYSALDRYAASGGTPGGRDEKTERGLLRYYTRTAMKATPFASFCAIIPGEFTDAAEGEDEVFRFHGDPRAKQSFVRINKLLYGILLDHLKARPAVRHSLVVEPNPTLRGEGQRLVFLTAIQAREVFQRVPANEVLQLILQVFRGKASPTLGDMIAALSADPQIEATPEEAEAYLEKLLEIGFIRFHTGIREQDADWDIPFRTLLDAIDDDHARRASELLAAVRARTDEYADAPVEARDGIVAAIHALIAEAFEAMEVTGRLRRDMPFYEDATAAASAEIPLTPGVARAAEVFTEYVRLTSRLAWPRSEQATMRHFYDDFYKDAPGVPLLQFYEDFYREHFKAHVEKEQKARGGADREALSGYDLQNPFGQEFVRDVSTARTRMGERIAERWRQDVDAEVLDLSLDELAETAGTVEAQPLPCRSVSAFALLVPQGAPDGDPTLVLQGSSYTAGYGKYFSRFLYMFPEGFVEDVRRDNAALTGELLAEICGDAQFNANLHPPLLRWEISYPTGEGGDAGDQLPSAALLVGPDPEDANALVLRHAPSGKRVIPVDLGFLNPRMRPPLYQLLSRFTPPVSFAPNLPETPYPPRRQAAAEGTSSAEGAAGATPEGGAEGAAADGDASPEASPASADVQPPAADATPSPEAAAPAVAAEGGVEAGAPDAPTPAVDGAEGAPAAEETPAPAAPRIVARPRITVEGRLVLARRRWLVPGVLFPQRAADESAEAFFIRANRWRAANALPETAYLRVVPLPDPAQKKPEAVEAPAEAKEEEAPMMAAPAEEQPEAPVPVGDEAAPADGAPDAGGEAKPAAPPKPATQPSRDFFKPQFMDFGNPLLVGLLGRMASGLKHFQIVVEERYPAREHLPEHGGETYATELVVQLNFPAGAVHAGTSATQEEAHAVAG